MTGSMEIRFGSSRRFFPAKFSMLSSLFPPSTCASHLPSSIIVKSCCHSTRLTPNTISFAICFLSPQPRLCSARLDPYLIIVPCTSFFWNQLRSLNCLLRVLSRTMKSALVDWTGVTRVGHDKEKGYVWAAARLCGKSTRGITTITGWDTFEQQRTYTRHSYDQ